MLTISHEYIILIRKTVLGVSFVAKSTIQLISFQKEEL